VILIHGFNVWDGGAASVGNLRPFFSVNSVCLMLRYGHFGLLETRFKNKKIAKRLHKAVTSAHKYGFKVVVVGHSNGCAIIHTAVKKYKTVIDKVVYINPALKKDLEPGDSVAAMDVWHSPSDKAVRWSKWLPASNARPWGEMGAVGYKGIPYDKVRNFDKENDYDVSSSKHSDVFKAEKLVFFGGEITARALE